VLAVNGWSDVAGSLVVLNFVLVAGTLVWVLHTKRETMSAIAWSLLVLLVPFFGAFLFFLLGSQSITRPIDRRRDRRTAYKKLSGGSEGRPPVDVPDRWDTLARLDTRLVRPAAVEALLEAHVARRQDNRRDLWALVMLQLWTEAHTPTIRGQA
jgi:hypothetical protein